MLARLDALAGAERGALGDFIEHLLEVDRREILTDRGYESTFTYCTKRLGYSEQAAFGRIRAARAASAHPEIIEKLRSGELNLEAIVRLYPHLTDQNKSEVLAMAAHAPKRKILEIVADLKGPEPSKPDMIKPLAKPKPPSVEAEPLLAGLQSAEVIPPPRRLRFEFEADDELVVMVERLRALLRHKFPFARLEDIFKEAAGCLLKKIDPGEKPREDARRAGRKPDLKRRWIPVAVKRLVWRRDGGRCAYVAPDGRRCESVDALQYDHVTPYSLGGASDDPANIRLLCRPHNQRLARRRFGPRPGKRGRAGGEGGPAA